MRDGCQPLKVTTRFCPRNATNIGHCGPPFFHPRNADTYASLQHKSKSYRPFFLQIPQSVLRETFIFPIIDYSCHIYI